MAKTTMFERSLTKVRFSNEDMDYLFQVVLGYHTYGGASFGELFRAATKVEDGEPESWISAFRAMGARIERQANELEEKGRASAAPAFLRAFTGYRAAAFLMNPKADFERFSETVESFGRCFRKAIPSFGSPCDPVNVPFEDNHLSGYFYRVDEQSTPRPTLIIVGGGDTFAEDLHFWAGAVGPRRGYNVLSLELPGYGMSPTRDLYLRADTEAPLGAAVDYALSRPEVDAPRLAAYGISGGGYAVTRAAARERRIRAVVADTPIYDIYRLITEAVPAFLLDESHSGVSRWLLQVSGRFNKAGKNNIDKFAWQAGKGSLLEALQVTKGEPVTVGAIECPMLCLAAEGDPPDALVQTREVYDLLENPKKGIRIFTAEEGAEAHTHVNNFPLLHQVVFDWLDDAFA
ncbi:MAG: esterase FrsA [Actinomycetota bacterium]|nr:esterase FrsA [Actinomycetota bacterium]